VLPFTVLIRKNVGIPIVLVVTANRRFWSALLVVSKDPNHLHQRNAGGGNPQQQQQRVAEEDLECVPVG
jgi:hypothetical protein